jgi:hypothetical protein
VVTFTPRSLCPYRKNSLILWNRIMHDEIGKLFWYFFILFEHPWSRYRRRQKKFLKQFLLSLSLRLATENRRLSGNILYSYRTWGIVFPHSLVACHAASNTHAQLSHVTPTPVPPPPVSVLKILKNKVKFQGARFSLKYPAIMGLSPHPVSLQIHPLKFCMYLFLTRVLMSPPISSLIFSG